MKNKNIDLLELEYSLAIKNKQKPLSQAEEELVVRKILSNLYDKSHGITKAGNKKYELEKEAVISGALNSLRGLSGKARGAFNTANTARNINEAIRGKDKPSEIPTEPWALAEFESTNESELYSWFQRGVATAKAKAEETAGEIAGKEVAENIAEKGTAGAAEKTIQEGAESAAEKGAAGIGKELLQEGSESWFKKYLSKFMKFIPVVGTFTNALMVVYNAGHATTLFSKISEVTKELDKEIELIGRTDLKTEKFSGRNPIILPHKLLKVANDYKEYPNVLGKVGKLCLHYEYLSRYVVSAIGDAANTLDDIFGFITSIPSLGGSFLLTTLSTAAIAVITEIAKAKAAGEYSEVRIGTVLNHIRNKGQTGEFSALLSSYSNDDVIIKKSNKNRPIIKSSR